MNKTIINGVDVSECVFFKERYTRIGDDVDNDISFENHCMLSEYPFNIGNCEKINCYFKQLKRLEQREKALTELADDLQKRNHDLTLTNEQLEQENKRLQMLSCANCGEKYLSPDGAELYDKNVQLQKENEELKADLKAETEQAHKWYQRETDKHFVAIKYKQALEKIREILYEQKPISDIPVSQSEFTIGELCNYDEKYIKIVGKINEVLNEHI